METRLAVEVTSRSVEHAQAAADHSNSAMEPQASGSYPAAAASKQQVFSTTACTVAGWLPLVCASIALLLRMISG